MRPKLGLAAQIVDAMGAPLVAVPSMDAGAIRSVIRTAADHV